MVAAAHTSFHIDASAWPVVVVRFPGTPPVDAEATAMLAEIGKQMARGRCAFVYDVPVFVLPNASQRRALIDGIVKNRTASPNAVICHAVSTPLGPMMQGLIKIVSWWSPAAEPVRVFDTVDDAMVWAKQQAAADQRT
jgi:hypothetical protein